MSNNPQQPAKILVSPLFKIPPGAEDLFEVVGTVPDSVTQALSEPSIYSTVSLDDYTLATNPGLPVYEPVGPAGLQTPQNIAIISQVVRRNGNVSTIDCILQVSEVDGATDYEVQVAQI